MLPFAPLQVIDSFLLQYNVGQAILLLFLLSLVGGLVQRSRKLIALQIITFGLLFLLTPQSLLEDIYYKFLGIALLMIGPMLYATAR